MVTKEQSNNSDSKRSKNIVGLADSNQLSVKAKAKGNSVTPYSLEEAFMGDQDDDEEIGHNQHDRTGSVLNGEGSHLDNKQWSMIPPPSLSGKDGAISDRALTDSKNNSKGNGSSQHLTIDKPYSESERLMPVISAAFDDRGAGIENPNKVLNESFQTEKEKTDKNSLDSLANL